MMKTSYSPIFNESLDFSCVIFNPQGNMLAQAEFCPSQIGTIEFTVTWTLAELGLEAFEPGDVLLHPGGQVKLIMPGGGGYGPATARDPDLIRTDVENGFRVAGARAKR